MKPKKRNKKYHNELEESAAEKIAEILVAQMAFNKNKNKYKKHGRSDKQTNN